MDSLSIFEQDMQSIMDGNDFLLVISVSAACLLLMYTNEENNRHGIY